MPRQDPPLSGANAPPGTEPDIIAAACLNYLAADPEQLARFLAAAGLTPGGLRQALGSAGLTRGLVDFFAANEDMLLAMSANSGIDAERLMRLWHQFNPNG